MTIRRGLATLALLALAAPVAAQDPQVCYESKLVPCGDPTVTTWPNPVKTKTHRNMPVFWSGLGMVAGGATMVVLATTTLQQSEPVLAARGPVVPCNTDPALAQGATIAPCKVNEPLLASGLAVAGGGGLLMWWGAHPVAVVVLPSRAIGMRVRF